MLRTIGLLILALMVGVPAAQAQTSPARRLVEQAAEALGGRARVMAVRQIKLQGGGQTAYHNGGSNIAGSPNAPMKWINLNGLQKTYDLAGGRMRVQQRRVADFGYAFLAQMTLGARDNFVLDGDIAYNVAMDGRVLRASDDQARQRRIEMLGTPVTIVRAALDPAARVSNFRRSEGLELVDLTTAKGDQMTLAVDPQTHLPAYVGWTDLIDGAAPLGDLHFRTWFTGYQAVDGLVLPYGYLTRHDWRNVEWAKFYVDRIIVDGPPDDMAAPANVRAATPPGPPVANAEKVADGVWLITGAGFNSIVLEFSDHITLYEVPLSNAWTKAIIEKARTLVPGKPVTQAIVSHNHFDHAGGIRQAVAEGLTIITQRGNVDYFREITARPSTRDDLGRNPKPIKIIAVDDFLKLKDATNEVDIYRVVGNAHMAYAVFAYVPKSKLMVEADLYDGGWLITYWDETWMDQVRYRKIDVERDVPVHGRISTTAEVQAGVAKQIRGILELCEKAEQASFGVAGCPAFNSLK